MVTDTIADYLTRIRWHRWNKKGDVVETIEH